MKDKRLKILGIFLGLSLVLFNYQNCGSKNSSTPSQANNESIINRVVTGGISFVQTKATVSASDTELAINGLCSQEQSGGLIGWQALDQASNVIASGNSLCDRGSFEVLFAGVDNLDCGSKLTLIAKFGTKSRSELEIEKNCL